MSSLLQFAGLIYMAAHYYYKPLAKNTMKIEDITPNARNREILHRLNSNANPSLDKLCIRDDGSSDIMRGIYVPGEEEDLSWLGNYLEFIRL